MPEPLYKERVRIRVNGLLVQDDALLMVKINSPVTQEHVWIPPGGGLEFGETMEKCLVREFREETGLKIAVEGLRHVNELYQPPFQAVEFYFDVSRREGELRLGNDPEQPGTDQILQELQFIPFEEFSRLPISPGYICSQFLEDFRADRREITYSPYNS